MKPRLIDDEISTWTSLGIQLSRSPRAAFAARAYRMAINIAVEERFPTSSELPSALASLIDIYVERGADDKAEEVFAKVSRHVAENVGIDHPGMIRLLFIGASLQRRLGRDEEADAYLNQARAAIVK